MSGKVVSIEKMSKKEQKRHYARFRGSWDGVNPVSRCVPSGKLYRRCKKKNEDHLCDKGEQQ